MNFLSSGHGSTASAGSERNSKEGCPPSSGAPVLRTPYHRIVGRFYHLRRLSSVGMGIGQLFGLRGTRSVPSPWIDSCLGELRLQGVSQAPRLPCETVERIYRYGIETPCVRSCFDPEHFLFAEIENGRTPNGMPVAVADVLNPSACDRVAETAADPLLLETARRYLGYHPRHIRTRLFWSPVSDLTDDERRNNGQTVDFHYDIEACNSFYAYFYITSAGPTSGAHVVVTGSHKTKPLSMIFARSYQPDPRVIAYYGTESIAVVSGEAGFGFFEDPACFHKALAPTTASRLCLQLRYM